MHGVGSAVLQFVGNKLVAVWLYTSTPCWYNLPVLHCSQEWQMYEGCLMNQRKSTCSHKAGMPHVQCKLQAQDTYACALLTMSMLTSCSPLLAVVIYIIAAATVDGISCHVAVHFVCRRQRCEPGPHEAGHIAAPPLQFVYRH
jgi:hypothetical protein